MKCLLDREGETFSSSRLTAAWLIIPREHQRHDLRTNYKWICLFFYSKLKSTLYDLVPPSGTVAGCSCYSGCTQNNQLCFVHSGLMQNMADPIQEDLLHLKT